MKIQIKTCLNIQTVIHALATSFATALVLDSACGQEILHSFPGVQEPDAALVQGTNGNFYGTTHRGGDADLGTVFKMTSAGVLTTVVSFNGANGGHPYAGLTLGTNGDFYGTTYDGGSLSRGTVFKVTSNGVLTSLVSFNGTNGGFPVAGLTPGVIGQCDHGGQYDAVQHNQCPDGRTQSRFHTSSKIVFTEPSAIDGCC